MPDPLSLVRLAALLVYTFAASAYFGMLVWMNRGGRPGCRNAVGNGLMSLSFTWFVVQVLATLKGPFHWQWLMAMRLELMYLFPPLIAHSAYARSKQWLGANRRWRVGVAAIYCASVALIAAFLTTIPGVAPAAINLTLGLAVPTLFGAAILFHARVVRATRQTPVLFTDPSGGTLDPAEKAVARKRVLRLMGWVMALSVTMIPVYAGWLREGDFEQFIAPRSVPFAIINIPMNSVPLAFLFIETYFGNRFQFVDLFVKRGASLLLTIVLLTAYFAIALRVMSGFEPAWAQPWAYAVALLPLALSLPWLYGRLGTWLDDRWLGRQFTAVEAVKHFLATIHGATSEEQLIEQAERAIATIFHAPASIVLDPAAGPELPGARPPASPSQTAVVQKSLEAPIRSVGGDVGTIRLGRRADRRPLFSEDAALLRALAEVFTYQLDNVRLQRKRREQENLARELSLQASRSHLQTLRAQINPHFLFNALNAVAALIHKDPARADQTVERLADVFRYTLRGSLAEWARVEDELDFVRAYLEVEQARFGDRVRFTITLEETVKSVMVPTMMVQTIVENAVKHGLGSVKGPGRIEVDVRQKDDRLSIDVADNGAGFEEPSGDASPRTEGAGYGLRNIRDRLHGYFGEQARLVVQRDAGRQMTVVSIVMPLSTGLSAIA
jgi:GAF domain-containing protein